MITGLEVPSECPAKNTLCATTRRPIMNTASVDVFRVVFYYSDEHVHDNRLLFMLCLLAIHYLDKQKQQMQLFVSFRLIYYSFKGKFCAAFV